MTMRVPRALFVCVHNAGRSQMAAAFFNAMAAGRAVGLSAGTQPATHVHPEVVVAMRERGLDLANVTPQLLTVKTLSQADRVLMMGCSVEEACPGAFIKQAEDWALPDPQGQSLERVRETRDIIELKVRELLQSMGIEPAAFAGDGAHQASGRQRSS